MKTGIKRALIIIFSLLLILSLVMILRQFILYRQASEEYEGLNQVVIGTAPPEGAERPPSETNAQDVKETAPFRVDFETLQAQNPDIVGWVYCGGLEISYPILRGDSNDKYLHHMWNGEYSVSGSIFMDYRNRDNFSDRNTVLFGHNMKDGSMFAGLDSYLEQSFYDENPVWYIMTPERDYKVVLFSGYVTKVGSEAYDKEFSDADWQEWLDQAVSQSSFRADATPGSDSRVVTFSTCAYVYQDARFVLHGVLTELDGK